MGLRVMVIFCPQLLALLGLFSLGCDLSCKNHRPDFSLTSATQLLHLEYKSYYFSFRCFPQQPRIFSMHQQCQEETKLVQPFKLSLQLPAPLFGCCDSLALPESSRCCAGIAGHVERSTHSMVWNVKHQSGLTGCCEAAPTVVEFLPIQQLWGVSLQPLRWLQPEPFTSCMLLTQGWHKCLSRSSGVFWIASEC